ncbi:SDR family oxidoreductase [Bordetella sp. N]|uniref:SDR family oxidoreductase n=1 Tax=Bordetella sp. N TaxID=1746199 RepID=UPI00070AC37B|nr:SDR family oxidoreductase [Bordetella sp. N]ALM82279.1 short-chain dehydrogenase [Bordetella sp. N]
MSEQRLQGKVALVTGAGRGIGRAIARRLARDGATVVVHFRENARAAQDTLASIEAAGGKGFLVQADLAVVDGPGLLWQRFDTALREYGLPAGLDILVNNAGAGGAKIIDQVTLEDFELGIGLNLRAPFFVTRDALPRLRDGGRIVNISSTRTQRAAPPSAVYASAKAGLEALTVLLAQQLGPRGITVNAVLPGATATDANPRANEPVAAREKAKEIALGRVGQPEDIADVVAFLASADGRWVTGQRIAASGGQLL